MNNRGLAIRHQKIVKHWMNQRDALKKTIYRMEKAGHQTGGQRQLLKRIEERIKRLGGVAGYTLEAKR